MSQNKEKKTERLWLVLGVLVVLILSAFLTILNTSDRLPSESSSEFFRGD